MLSLLCHKFGLLGLQFFDLGIIEVLISELLIYLLFSKLIRVDREDFITGQLSVVLPREEEVLHFHVSLAKISILCLDQKLKAIAHFTQAVA